MKSLRWAKQNTTIWYGGWLITAIIGSVTQILLLSLGRIGLLINLLVLIAGLTLTAILRNRYANSMERILLSNYKEVQSAIGVVFKNKNIRFYRQSEDQLYIFKFSWPALILIIEPHIFLGVHMNPQPATKLTLKGLNGQNQEISQILIKYIDEIDHYGLVQTKPLWK